MQRRLFETFFASALPELDLDAIYAEWMACQPPFAIADRHLPIPAWARRAFTETGRDAWRVLQAELAGIPVQRPLAVYVHIPFCHRRCHFCDCYSFHLKSHHDDHIRRYVDLLKQEVALWAGSGLAQRPVSTVHFGGGTPTTLGPVAFADLVQTCAAQLHTTAETEWALETTSSEFSPEMADTLYQLGFRRLHIGVQSLQAAVRQHINRQETGAMVLEKIAYALAQGWVVSVDMIFGLPEQTLNGFLADLKTLADLGVDGFSLYELQHSPRNRAFWQVHSLEHLPREWFYFFAQASAHYLAALGYQKTLFNHYARASDTNLYFTFPERGEDCLALGTIADGVFGDYHYRHPVYAEYCRESGGQFPGLQGGLRRNRLESSLHPLFTALMGNRVPPELLAEIVPPQRVQQWLERRLLALHPTAGWYELTGNGSWFVGNMIDQLITDHR